MSRITACSIVEYSVTGLVTTICVGTSVFYVVALYSEYLKLREEIARRRKIIDSIEKKR